MRRHLKQDDAIVERMARPKARYTADAKPRNARAIERDRAERYGTV